MIVCIAEKPSVAREIAQVIGATARKDGFLEGNGYQVTWTFGHFCTLKAPDDYQAHWKRWDLNTLPMLPPTFETKLIDNGGVKKQFGIIQTLLQTADRVINCGDAGQEGELIQRWVLKEAKYQGPVQRLWISSLTTEAIRDGFQQLRPAGDFDNLYYAGFSRAIGDWLLGMNATRLYTLKYGGREQVLSIGRVQTPTLAMLVNRHYEILHFKPQTYWELHTVYRDTTFQCQKGKIEKKESGEELLNRVKGQPFTILSVEKKQGKEGPPRLFDLTSLQVHANKKFGFSADKTLKIAQSLYEQKVITYPRVDTTYLPNDLYPKVPGILNNLRQYAAFVQPLLQSKLRKSGKVFNDKKVTDHHAIIPTGIERNLGVDEQQVYDAITRRFIAAFYPDCLVANTTVIGESAGLKFKATGKEILEPGWRVLYPKSSKAKTEEEEKDKEEKILPSFVKGESGPHDPKLVEKQTKPPKPYTEATLLRAMETAGKKVDDEELRDLMKANGIGRPSTRANIIETLFKRKYTRRNRKQILPTETGIKLIDTIQNELLKSAEMTGQWEKQLREIEAGEYGVRQFVDGMRHMVSNLVVEVRRSQQHIVISAAQAAETKKKAPKKAKAPSEVQYQSCPKCREGKLLKGKSAFGCSRWKAGCDFRLPFVFLDKKISDKQLLRMLKKGETVTLKGFKQEGQSVAGKIRITGDFHLEFLPETPTPQKIPKRRTCPKCQQGEVIKGKSAYGCSRWKEGCDFKVTFEHVRQAAQGKALSKELVWQILTTS
ncbi:MAG: DNA topoisomerase 3 [Bacteroidota bacterium]